MLQTPRQIYGIVIYINKANLNLNEFYCTIEESEVSKAFVDYPAGFAHA